MWLGRTRRTPAQHHPGNRQGGRTQRQQPPHQRVHPPRVRITTKREVPRSRCRVRLPLAHQPVLLGTSTAQNLGSLRWGVNAVAGIARLACGSSWGNRGDRPRLHCGRTVHGAVDGSGDESHPPGEQGVARSPGCGRKKVRGVLLTVMSVLPEPHPRRVPARWHRCQSAAQPLGTSADPMTRH